MPVPLIDIRGACNMNLIISLRKSNAKAGYHPGHQPPPQKKKKRNSKPSLRCFVEFQNFNVLLPLRLSATKTYKFLATPTLTKFQFPR